MTHRILDPSEWSRLSGTELRDVWQWLQPDRTRILVVEDEQGAIVGCWAFLYVLHAEGVYIAPEHRGRSAVARHLLRGMREIAQASDASSVWTGALDETIAAFCQRLDAREIPGRSFVIPTLKGES